MPILLFIFAGFYALGGVVAAAMLTGDPFAVAVLGAIYIFSGLSAGALFLTLGLLLSRLNALRAEIEEERLLRK